MPRACLKERMRRIERERERVGERGRKRHRDDTTKLRADCIKMSVVKQLFYVK